MANLSIEEPYAVMPARTGLWEPRDGNDPGPPGPVVVGPQRSMLRSNSLMLETEISERAQRHTTMR